MMNRIGHPFFALLLLVLAPACSSKVEFIEIEKFTSNTNEKYYFRVLVKNPPSNRDSLKKQLVQFYCKKNEELQMIDSSYYISYIRFYNKTRCSSYFIDHDEDHTGFFTDILDDCNDLIGGINGRAQYPDSTSTKDIIIIYKKTDTGISMESYDTLFFSSNGIIIDNWYKYK